MTRNWPLMRFNLIPHSIRATSVRQREVLVLEDRSRTTKITVFCSGDSIISFTACFGFAWRRNRARPVGGRIDVDTAGAFTEFIITLPRDNGTVASEK